MLELSELDTVWLKQVGGSFIAVYFQHECVGAFMQDFSTRHYITLSVGDGADEDADVYFASSDFEAIMWMISEWKEPNERV
jgi:hypothetical protein